jgi:hypothetical protein
MHPAEDSGMTNEAAERLNKWAPLAKADPADYLLWLQTKQEAIAAERRATVERIRAEVQKKAGTILLGFRISDFLAILDEEAAR